MSGDRRVPEDPTDRQVALVRVAAHLFTASGLKTVDLAILPSAVGNEGGEASEATRSVILVLAPPSVGPTIDAQTLTPLLVLDLATIEAVCEQLRKAKQTIEAVEAEQLQRTHVVPGVKGGS